MSGNGRNFGALTFERLLRNYILGGGHEIPILKTSRAPVQAANAPEHDKPPDKPEQPTEVRFASFQSNGVKRVNLAQ